MADVAVMPAPAASVSAPAAPVTSTPAVTTTPASTSTTAPSPAAGSTTSTTPTPTPTPTTVDPAAAGLGAGSGAVETPAVDASGAAAAAAAPAGKVPPKPEDFDSGPEGYQQYLAAKWEFEAENGTLGQQPAATEADAAAAETAAAETTPVAEIENKAAVEQKEPEPAPTPEVLAGWMDKSPEFKAAMNAAPELKEQLFTMARVNAQLAPIAEIFPDVQSAQFANDTASQFVELQTGFQMAAEDPETFPQAFAKFEDMFRLRDEKGEYVRDAAGNIRVGDDFNLLTEHLVNGYHRGELQTFEQQAQQIQQRLETAIYPSAAAKQADEAALERAEIAISALKYVQSLKEDGGEAKPDLSKIADPAVRAYYERKEAELAEERKRLGQDKAEGAKGARKEARQKYETEYRSKFGGQVGKRIGELVKAKLDAGTVIPSYVLEDRDPKTNAPLFAVRVLSEFEKKTGSIAGVKDKQAKLQLLPPTPQAMEQRLRYQNELIEQFLPGIIDAEVKKVQARVKADADARGAQLNNRGTVAQAEPRSGGSPQPRTMTDDQIAAQARENVSKTPGYAEMSPADKMTAELTEKYRLRSRA